MASVNASEAAAYALLRGDDSKPSKKKRTIRNIVEDRAIARVALNKAQTQVELARREMAAESFAAAQAELQEVGAGIIEALFNLDRALRAKDKLVRRIGLPPGTIWFEGWPLAGRLGNTASETYRSLSLAWRMDATRKVILTKSSRRPARPITGDNRGNGHGNPQTKIRTCS